MPVRVSFEAYDFGGIWHRGAVTSTKPVRNVIEMLRRQYAVILISHLRLEAKAPEHVALFDARTNTRLAENEPGILDACQGI